jgi:uncharacterized membrane protein
MKKPAIPEVKCSICGRPRSPGELVPGDLLRPAVTAAIVRDHPEWTTAGPVCLDDLNHYRALSVQEMLREERGELTALDEEVVRSLRDEELVSRDVNQTFDRQLGIEERVADRVAQFGGSWRFILIFGAILVVWIAVNSGFLLRRPIDPFPYILLNLGLSCIAAIQAPIIMMSQKRQETRDRLRAEHDYQVNLKAELEIRLLSTRFDHLLGRQWQRLLEIQEVQTELMEEIATHRRTVEDVSFERS